MREVMQLTDYKSYYASNNTLKIHAFVIEYKYFNYPSALQYDFAMNRLPCLAMHQHSL